MNNKKQVKRIVEEMAIMEKMESKKVKSVRIYGLPRSGTNYLEYLIRNNTDLAYQNEFEWNEYLGEETAVKHCPPAPHDKDLTLMLFKQRGNFIKSFSKWNEEIDPVRLYDRAMSDYLDFAARFKNTTLVVSYELLLNNESKLMDEFSARYGVTVSESIDIPQFAMDRDGGISQLESLFIRPEDLTIDDHPINQHLAFQSSEESI